MFNRPHENRAQAFTVKAKIHPDYGQVVFRDKSADFMFLTRSTRRGSQTIEWSDGRRYPLVDVEVSSASHPIYTGRTRILDTAGQVEKFRRRYQSRSGQ